MESVKAFPFFGRVRVTFKAVPDRETRYSPVSSTIFHDRCCFGGVGFGVPELEIVLLLLATKAAPALLPYGMPISLDIHCPTLQSLFKSTPVLIPEFSRV